MPNKKITQLDTRVSPALTDYLVVADPSTGYAYKELGSTFIDLAKATLVPYTGATASVNLGSYNLTANQIIKSGGLATEFLKADGSVDSTTYMNRAVYDTNADGVVDEAEKMTTWGRNSTGSTLYKGTIIYILGGTGNRPNFVKAQANIEATSAGTFGVVISDIANNTDGKVATIGTLHDLDTRSTATNPFTTDTLADGDTIYLSPTTAGYVTNVKPSAPNHIVYVGKVVRTSPTLGTIVYRIQNGYELGEIHDVAISSVANNEVLVYESATSLWKNKTIATILGYTPADDSLVMKLAGSQTATGYKIFSIGLQTNTGDNYLNYTSGATYIGYSAAPVGGYKLAVNGTSFISNKLTLDNGIFQKNLYTNTSAGVVNFKIGTAYEIYGTLHSAGGYTSYITTSDFASGWDIIIGTNIYKSLNISFQNVTSNVDFKAIAGISNITGNGSMSTYYSSPYEGFKVNTTNGWGYAIFNSTNSPMMTVKYTGQLQLNGYTSTSVFTGTLAGLLGFDSSGNVITSTPLSGSGTAGQVTYWSGTSAVTGNANFIYQSGTGNLQLGTSTTSGYRLDINGTGASTGALRVTGGNVLFGTTGLSYDNTNNRIGIGTNSPSYLLHVAGVAYISSNLAVDGYMYPLSTGNSNTLRIHAAASSVLDLGYYTGSQNGTSGTKSMITASPTFSPSSGAATFIGYNFVPTINQSGTAAGTTYGVFINPTLTSAYDWKSVAWFNNTGYGLYGAGTANNYVSGNFGFQQTSPTAIADFGASTTSKASLRIRSGTAPTSPNDGDIWFTGTDIKIQVGGVTKTFTIV